MSQDIYRHFGFDGHLPFTYLSIPIFIGQEKRFLYDDIIANIMVKLRSWEVKCLFFTGRKVLIISKALNSMWTYMIQVMDLSKELLIGFTALINFFRGTLPLKNLDTEPYGTK